MKNSNKSNKRIIIAGTFLIISVSAVIFTIMEHYGYCYKTGTADMRSEIAPPVESLAHHVYAALEPTPCKRTAEEVEAAVKAYLQQHPGKTAVDFSDWDDYPYVATAEYRYSADEAACVNEYVQRTRVRPPKRWIAGETYRLYLTTCLEDVAGMGDHIFDAADTPAPIDNE